MSTLEVGDRVRFDDAATSWLVRASACAGRYHIATCSMFGAVWYTIIDHHDRVRGAMNLVGQGLDIFTTSGPDKAIDAAVRMLEADEGWGISHRNSVPLNITRHVAKARA